MKLLKKHKLVYLQAGLVALIVIGTDLLLGYLSNSISLVSDAGHAAADIGIYAIAFFAVNHGKNTGARINGVIILCVAVALGIEAVVRIYHPERISGGFVILSAVATLLLNLWQNSILVSKNLPIEEEDLKASLMAHNWWDAMFQIPLILGGIFFLLWPENEPIQRLDSMLSLFFCFKMAQAGIEFVADGKHDHSGHKHSHGPKHIHGHEHEENWID